MDTFHVTNGFLYILSLIIRFMCIFAIYARVLSQSVSRSIFARKKKEKLIENLIAISIQHSKHLFCQAYHMANPQAKTLHDTLTSL